MNLTLRDPTYADRPTRGRRLASLAIAAVLVAFASTPVALAQATPPVRLPPFNAADVAWSTLPGSATVEGVARVGLSAVRTCAGAEAQLVPDSAFATAMMRTVFGNSTRGYVTLASSPPYPRNIPPDFAKSIRRVACSPTGEFRFEAVPAGTWFVFANAIWREGDEATPRGGSLMKRVDVAERATVRVVLEP